MIQTTQGGPLNMEKRFLFSGIAIYWLASRSVPSL